MTKKIVLLGLFVLVLPAVVSAGIGPRISLSEVEHDFGDVMHGGSPTAEITVTNTGDEVLVLERIGSSCGCAKALRGSPQVTPGSTSTISARIETLGMSRGRHSKTLTVHSNDSAHPVTSVKLVFTVIRHLSISPDFLAATVSQSDKDPVFPVKAANHWTNPITLNGEECSSSGEVTMQPKTVVVPAGSTVDFQFSIRVKREPARNYVKGIALIATDDPLEKRLPVRYFIRLAPTGRR